MEVNFLEMVFNMSKFVYLGFPIFNMRTSSAHHSFPNWLTLNDDVTHKQECK